uniref:Uncharacterized protein n=1 Tax=Tetraselmis sp. GSL018 TaxID=582737 RepID=A0A061R6U0_9CHLO
MDAAACWLPRCRADPPIALPARAAACSPVRAHVAALRPCPLPLPPLPEQVQDLVQNVLRGLLVRRQCDVTESEEERLQLIPRAQLCPEPPLRCLAAPALVPELPLELLSRLRLLLEGRVRLPPPGPLRLVPLAVVLLGLLLRAALSLPLVELGPRRFSFRPVLEARSLEFGLQRAHLLLEGLLVERRVAELA